MDDNEKTVAILTERIVLIKGPDYEIYYNSTCSF